MWMSSNWFQSNIIKAISNWDQTVKYIAANGFVITEGSLLINV